MLRSKPLPQGTMPWASMFSRISMALAILALVGTIGGGLSAGLPAAAAFLSGLALVYLTFASGVLLMLLTQKRSMKTAALALLASYPVKILIFTCLLLLAPLPEAWRNGWMLTGSLLALGVQLVMETKIIWKQRILYFDSVG